MGKQRAPVIPIGDISDSVYARARELLARLSQVDPITYSHCLRVGQGALQLAKAAGLNPLEQKQAEFVGLLHDIGKIGIDREVLHKPARLTDAEYELVKRHPEISEQMLLPLQDLAFFQSIIPGIRGHHERVDGRGYPDGLADEEIPLFARLVLVVDTLDAMTVDRPYRKGLPLERVYSELSQHKGTQFDSQLVRIFLESHPHWQKTETDQETFERIIKATG